MKIMRLINSLNSFFRWKKQFSHSFDRLHHSIFQRLESPEMIEWFPTYRCNSKCRYCGGYDKEAISNFDKLVPLEEILKVVEESGRQGTKIWNIGGRGGEPLLYPNLIQVLRRIKKCGMEGVLISNGILFDEAFVKALVEIKWDTLRVSLDSHVADIHDQIRGVEGNFKAIDTALDLFKIYKEKYHTSYPKLICCPVIHNHNYQYLSQYIDYCKRQQVEEVQFMPLIEVHSAAASLRLSKNQKEEVVDLLKHVQENISIKNNIDFLISLYQSQDTEAFSSSKRVGLYCIHLWKTMVISEDGYLSPCSLIKSRLAKLSTPYQSIWSGDKLNKLRNKILNGQSIDKACENCCGPLRDETKQFNDYLTHKKDKT